MYDDEKVLIAKVILLKNYVAWVIDCKFWFVFAVMVAEEDTKLIPARYVKSAWSVSSWVTLSPLSMSVVMVFAVPLGPRP